MDVPILTPALAAEIAAETTEVLGLNVLITDAAAVVIGSGDRARVGTVHEASVEVLATGRAASHTAEAAAALSGVLPGITMPIVIDDVVVGTVGITGPPRRVLRLGRLVQRQTEILLRESASQRTRMLREAAVTQLVRDITLFDPRVVNERVVLGRATELGYDLRQDRLALVVDVAPGPVPQPSAVRTVAEAFGSPADVVAELATGRYVVLHRLGTDRHRGPEPTPEGRARRAADLIRRRHGPGTTVRIGLGEPASTLTALARSYADATTALRLAHLAGDQSGVQVCAIDELRIPQVLAAAAGQDRERFVEVHLSRLKDEPDYAAMHDTLVAWCESGFNLVATARALGIHRNSVVYRLDKIHHITQRDVRAPLVAISLYLACVADRL